MNAADRIKVEHDPLVEDAVAHMSEAKLLLDNVHKYMAMIAEKSKASSPTVSASR